MKYIGKIASGLERTQVKKVFQTNQMGKVFFFSLARASFQLHKSIVYMDCLQVFICKGDTRITFLGNQNFYLG